MCNNTYLFILGMHDIRYADIFQLILVDNRSRYRYISYCLETTPRLFCAEIIR